MDKKNITPIAVVSTVALGLYFCVVGGVFAAANATVTTNAATNIQSTSVTLNGNISNVTGGTTTVWFEWGSSTAYGNSTTQQTETAAGSFSQVATNLSPNTMYHYRADVQDTYGITYGQDMTFTTLPTPTAMVSPLVVSKNVINLTSKNLSWENSVSAAPGDILSFAITIQGGSQDTHNVMIKDVLPAGLIYKGELTENASINTTDNPTTGINVGTIAANGIEIISYQVQVAPASTFTGTTATLSNSATVTSTEGGTQNVSATAMVNTQAMSANGNVSGPTSVPTGLTNNFFTDSFFLPLLITMGGVWLAYRMIKNKSKA